MAKRYRRGRLNKQLHEIAAAQGYTPGEFSVARFAQDAKKLKEWAKEIDRGLLPEDLGHMNINAASALVRREINDMIKRERDWLPFFYPQMKSTEVSGSLNVTRNAEELSDDELAAIAAGGGE